MEFPIEELQLTEFTTMQCGTLVSSGVFARSVIVWGTSADVVRYNALASAVMSSHCL